MGGRYLARLGSAFDGDRVGRDRGMRCLVPALEHHVKRSHLDTIAASLLGVIEGVVGLASSSDTSSVRSWQ